VNFKVDAPTLKKLCRVFPAGEYPISFHAHPGDPGHVCVSAYDGIKFIQGSFDAMVIEAGEVIFSSEYLDRAVRLEGPVTMRYLNEDITIKDDVRPFHIPLITPDGPYLMPENKMPLGSITIELDAIKTLIRRVRFATGVGEKSGFDCVLLEFGDFIRAVGCDKRTLAVAKVLQGSPYKGRFLLPKQGLDVISKLDGYMATLTLYGRGIGISVGGEVMFDIYIPERGATFPSYEEILKIPVNTTMRCSQEELMSVLSDMRLHSDEVSMTFTYASYAKQAPRFRARDDNGAHMERSCGRWEGRDLKVKANARVIEQAVENISGTVTFGFSNDLGPFSISNDRNDYVAVLQSYAPGRK
jgi:DNA polymerase III sliding clamp (beta) subunit (PCNA family)